MTYDELIVWCLDNPMAAADRIEELEARLGAALGLPADRLLANGDYYVLHSKIKAALKEKQE